MLIDHLPVALRRRSCCDRWWVRSWSQHPPPDSADNGVGDYFAVGREFSTCLLDYCDLQPSDAVLDVGCGSGRIALGLARQLNRRGRYAGFDVRREAIDWCTRHITARYPNFQFTVADVLNHAYRPDGVTAATAFRFPYPDQAFNLAVLTSVFTHMRPDDVRSYLAEIHRVLRPGGRCFITWFVLDEETRRLTAEHRSTLGFHWPQGEAWAADQRAVEIATGYDEPWVRAAYARAGFTLTHDIIRGWWPGRERAAHPNYQDFIIARRD